MKKGIFSLMMALLFAFTGVLRADELTVYDVTTSTNYLPLYGYYADAYTRSQYVIPAADLSVMTGTQITGLRYYTSNTADWGVDYYVYLAEVSNTTLSGLIDRSAATVVYTGHLAAANGGMTISFDTPYTYNGGNLLIGMDNLSQGTYISCYWVATAVTNAGYYGYSYSSPTIMSSAASNSYIPKTTFTYYSDVTDIQLTLTPDPVDFGARPNNCWMRPMVATLSNEGPRAGIYGVDVDNNYFVPEELEIPFTLAGDESVDLHFGWTSAPEGEVTGTLVIDGQSRDAFLFDMTAYAYEPVEPDVWEMARVISNPTDYRDTPTTVTLYNNYLLPPTDVEDGNDAVYKLTIDHDMLLEGDVFQTGTETAAENGKIAVYTQAGIDEVGGPDLENNYTGPIGGRGNRTANELTVFDGTATNYYVPVFTYCGDRLAAAQIVIPSYELSAMTGGTITSLKFHVDHVSTGGSGMDAVWKGYVKEVNYTEMTDMEDPSTATEIFNGVVSVNDYMEMVIDFSTPYTYNGGDLLIGFDVATTFGHYRAVHFLGQNDHTNAAMYRTVPYVSPTAVNFLPKTTFTYEPASTPGSEPDHLLNVTMVPGTYYIAASSTEDAWDVVLNASELPCPEVAYSPIPNDDADNLTPSAVTLRWRLGQYATEYRLLFGTTYYCENVLVDWTTDLAESYTVTNLFNNTNYFWRIEERNDGCPQGIQGPVWGFTTTFNAPTNLHATNANGTNIYEGETLHLAWNAIQDRTFRSYNVYMDGNLIGSTPSNPNPATTTTFDVEGLTYNMGGHVFNVTAVYDEGESLFSNELVINVSGEGEVDGYVYEQDGTTGIAGATVTMNGIDEFGRFHTYTFTTDANGHYHGSMFAGSYYGTASCQGYQEVAYENNPFEIVYGEVTPDINYVMDEVFTPVGEVIAEYYPDPEDPESPYVKVYWGWNIMSAMIEDFETGDFSQYDWNIPAQYPFEITTNNPYEGAYCMQSTNYNVASSTSSIDVTVEIPRDGLMSFYKRISCESSWDMAYFYIDGAQVATFTGTSGWGVKEVAITEGTHNFKWAYTKDGSVNSGEDRFFIDYIDFIHDAQPAQPGWHTYAEGEFDNALGSNLTTTPSWGYMYPNGGGYAGMRLTKVALFSDNQYTAVGGNYTCTIYTGGATPDQGTPVSTMTVDVPSNQNAWVEYDLSTPVAVSGNENLWVIWTCNTCVSSWPAGLAAGSEANGSWWNGGESWEQVVDSYGVFTMKNYFTNRSGRTVEATYADNKTVNQPIQVAPFAQATGNHVENATTVANPNLERVATANANDRSFQYFRVYRTDCYNDGPYTEENTVVCCCELHDTAYIDVEWPDLAPGVYKWGVGCVYGGNRESEIAWSEPTVVPAQGQAAEATRDIIEIGNGTSSSYITPYNSLWGYSVVEQIYTAAEIGTSGTINSISFYMDPANTSNAAQTNSVDVFMKNVTRSDFTEGYEPLAATDMVFSGTVTFNLGWTTITLDNPFQYTGYSNLMIALHEYTPGYSTRFFCYTDADDAVISFHSDSANPDPYNLGSFSGTNYLSNYRPNIQIDITAVTPYNNDPIQEERESPIV